MNKRLEDVARKIETAFHQFLIALEGPVLMFDANHVIVARRSERSEELCPIDVTQTWQTRHLPAHALRQHTIVIETFAVDVQIMKPVPATPTPMVCFVSCFVITTMSLNLLRTWMRRAARPLSSA